MGSQVRSKGSASASDHARRRLDRIAMPGFSSHCGSGNPALPCRTIYIALPTRRRREQSFVLSRLSLSSAVLPGTYDLAPAPGIAPVGETAPRFGMARNASVYGADAFYPREQVRLAAVGRMRACKIAELEYWPYAYNPVSGKLRKMESTAVTLSFDRVSQPLAGLRDSDDPSARVRLEPRRGRGLVRPGRAGRAGACVARLRDHHDDGYREFYRQPARICRPAGAQRVRCHDRD